MDKNRFRHPKNEDRPYMLRHDLAEGEAAEKLDALLNAGFGGVVTNAAWHREKGDPAGYLAADEDFRLLDDAVCAAKKRDMGVWLYDEKGYPSASADGLTMLGHPEYEARGFTEIRTGGTDWVRPDIFEKIIYACREDGSPVPFTADIARGADRVYVVRPVFEGSHAQKCGYGPRHYPNIMDQAAVQAFIRCTYDRYFEKTGAFSSFDAVFTDEPSLMSAFVNCSVPMPHAFLPWAEDLPAVFRQMHGCELWEDISVLFSKEERFEEGKVRFWRTVAEMVSRAYFTQIADWCAAHGIAFSGHCLLEESLSMHVPLYGDLMKQLKTFHWPGVDMLTGDAELYWFSGMDYAMAARYVGSAARMTGKTERVMVEICPIHRKIQERDFTFEEQRGTMALLFRAGINHINSYLKPERLGDDFPKYADMFARAAYMLRGARWVGRIGVYYPVETAQGYYAPDTVGVNCGARLPEAILSAEKTLAALNRSIGSAGLDYTLIDGDWVQEAGIEDGMLSANGLEISALIMPAVRWLSRDVLEKINAFVRAGGRVLWTGAKPDGIDDVLTENAAAALPERVDYGLCLEAQNPESILVSPYEKEGKRMWYLVNNSPNEAVVTASLREGSAVISAWDLLTGTVSEAGRLQSFCIPAYSAVVVTEEIS